MKRRGSEVGAILYDFKRSFLRPATLIALVLFIVAGIGLSYSISISLSTTGGLGSLFLGYAELNSTEGKLHVELYTYDYSLNPAKATANLTLYLVNSTQPFGSTRTAILLNQTIMDINGYSNLTLSFDPDEFRSLEESGLRPILTIQVSGTGGSISVGQPISDGVPYCSSFCLTFRGPGNSTINGTASAYYKDNMTEVIILLSLPGEGYKMYYIPNISSIISSEGSILKNAVFLGMATSGLNRFTIGSASENQSELYFALEGPGGELYIDYIPEPPQPLPSSSVQSRVAGAALSSAGLSLFAEFFPIVVLYLAYALIAKPRGMGALEFILARPITRWDLYYTRYLAGSLTVLASSSLFFASFAAANSLLIGYNLSTESFLILFLGVAGSLLAFYSLCYLISTMAGSGRYLAVSIFVYFFFTMVYSLLSFILGYELYGASQDLFTKVTEIRYTMDYFSPLGLSDFASYFVGRGVGLSSYAEVSTVNPALVIISGLLWIAVPFLLGWKKFKKANLSS